MCNQISLRLLSGPSNVLLDLLEFNELTLRGSLRRSPSSFTRTSMALSPSSEGPKPTQVPPQTTPPASDETLHDGAPTQTTKADQPKRPLREQVLLLVVRPNGTLEFSSSVPPSKDFELMRLLVKNASTRQEESEFTFNLEKDRVALQLRCVDESGEPLDADVQRYGAITFRRKGAAFEIKQLETLDGKPVTSEQILRVVALKIIEQLEHDQRKRRAITARVADGFKTLGMDPKSARALQLEADLKKAVLSAHPESSKTQPVKAKGRPSWCALIDVPITLMTSYESATPHLAALILIHHLSEERFRTLSVEPPFERFLDGLCEPASFPKSLFPEGRRKTALANFIKDVRTKVNARK